MRRIPLKYCLPATVVILVGLWLLFPPRTRTDTIEVIAVDEGYDIRIRSNGRYLLPLTPEGPFPKWSEQTWYLAQGQGERETIDGVTYKKYRLGKDLETKWLSEMFSDCTVLVSADANRLVVQGELAADRKYLINHSGTYDGITIDHAEILPFTRHSKIEDVDHCYIRARGHVKDGRLETAGKTFAVDLWQEGDYEIVGRIYQRSGAIPFLEVSSYKRSSIE